MRDISELRNRLRNTVKERFARNELSLVFQVRQWRAVEIARIAKASGYDALNIDLEHSPTSIETASQICTMALEVGIATFVRIASKDLVPQLLDGGAMGIVAAHVESAEDARAWVREVKYPPIGKRSLSGSIPQFFAESWNDAEARAAVNDATMLVALIESRLGVEKIDEIAAVEGLDVLLVGAMDLSGDLGIPAQFDHPEMRRSFREVAAAGQKYGKQVGIGGLGFRPDLVAAYVEDGARWVSVGTDQHLLIMAARERARDLRALSLPELPAAAE